MEPTNEKYKSSSTKKLFKGRLHELIKCPFSAPISGPYIMNRPVLALKTGPSGISVESLIDLEHSNCGANPAKI